MSSLVPCANITLFYLLIGFGTPELAGAEPTSQEAPLTGTSACQLGHFLKNDQPERAMLYLERCHQFSASSELRRRLNLLRKKLSKKELATIALVLDPIDAVATLEEGLFFKDILRNEDELWLPMGHYKINIHADGYEDAAFAIDIDTPDRSVISLALERNTTATVVVNLGDEPGSELGDVSHAADMRAKKFKTLLAKRYQRAPDPIIPSDTPVNQGRGPWPVFALLSSAGSLGAGIALQLNGRQTSAFIGYGSGLILGGLGAYLFHRADSDDRAPTSGPVVSMGNGDVTLEYLIDW